VSKSELRVFVASPGGLDEERDAVEHVASLLNANFSDRLNVTIVVRRFEQRAARAGRPQRQINPWVDDCDVLVAVVHRRWGSLSGDGDHTGFSEEFDRAIERFEETGHPVVSLHFKAVDPDSEADAGPQLEQVMDFRRRIEAEHVALYQRFDSLDGFKLNIMQLLIEEMHEVANLQVTTDDSAASSEIPPESLVGSRADVEDDDAGIAQVLEDFAGALRGAKRESPLETDRLVLFANAIAREPEAPDTHLANRMFLRRSSTEFSAWELEAWFHAYVSDHGRSSQSSDRNVPFVLVVDKERLDAQLFNRTKTFLETDIDFLQKGYLRLLTALGLRPDFLWSAAGAEGVVSNWATLARTAPGADIVEYWATVSSRGDAQTAKVLSESAEPAVAKIGKALLVLADPELTTDAIVAVDPSLIFSRRVIERCGEILHRASSDVLVGLMKRKYLARDVHIAVVRAVARSDAWTAEMVADLVKEDRVASVLGDSWKPIARDLLFRTTAINIITLIVEEANKQPNDRSMILAQFAAINPEFRSVYLPKTPDYLAVGNLDVHFALHANDPSYRKTALKVLTGSFPPANQYIERLKESDTDENVIEFVRERNVASALTYLARSQASLPKSAWTLLRELAGTTGRFGFDLLAVLEEIATDADIPFLLDTIPSRWRGESERLARLLAKATLVRLRTILDHETPDLTVAALLELQRRDRPPSQSKLAGLLRHGDAVVRMTALRLLIPKIIDPVEYISKYVAAGATYYYNVVCELDRIASGSPEAY
jgi:hypothetical protein